ncbi:MAG: hypothetical protein ISS56_03045 [Anaerolineae bacterium]|nr:hypothetical protein [Anaerolineae bacterium]
MAQPPPCPYCSATSYRLEGQDTLICRECGHQFDTRQDLCPHCGYLNGAEATICTHCQAELSRNLAVKIIETRLKSRKEWHEERHAVAVEQKQQEQVASRKRTEERQAGEQARLEALAQAQAERMEHERRALWIVGITAGVVLVLLIAALVITSLS